MPCDHQFLAQHLDQMLDQSLDANLQAQLDNCLQQCAECRHTLEQAKCFHLFSQQWQEQSPPDWNRRLFPVRTINHAARWWQWASLATSVGAVLLVLFNSASNRSLLEEYAVEQREQQYLALNAVLDQSRLERNEELNMLYATWLEQRSSDQQIINERFNLVMDQQIDSNQYLNDLARSVTSTTQR